MASGRHKQPRTHSRKQRHWFSGSPRLARIAVPALAATLVTGTVVGSALAWPEQPADSVTAISGPVVTTAPEQPARSRVEVVSRSAPRVELTERPTKTPKPAPKPTAAPEKVRASEIADHLFMTTDLNVWSGPGEGYTLLTVLPAGTKVAVTGEVEGQWAEVAYEGLSRWVNATYLAEALPRPERPEPTPTEQARTASGISEAPCPSGSSVEDGLSSDAILVHRSACANFPQITSYGGLRSDGEHAQGLALDIMVSASLGDQVAEWARANSGSLGVSQVIWSQRIWTVQRSSEGWRPMEDRGSTTANHYDHVHVTVYGSSAG